MADFQPLTAADVDDENPRMLAGHLRALQREMRDGFESLARTLTAFERIESRLDVIIDRQNVLERRQDELELRVAALEAPKRRRPAARRKR